MSSPLPAQSHQPSSPLRHMLQLDGLRAIAVLLVFWQHWMPKSYTRGVTWGAYGVDLFFVLSGFLITGILLKCKSYLEEGRQTVGFTAKRFYIRRFLRIFPLYYAVLAVVSVIFAVDLGTKLSLWTYTYNVWAGFQGQLYGRIAHFWSLAVEEQFYVIWPAIILLTPRRFLLKTILVVIAIGPLSRLTLLQLGVPSEGARTFTLSCFDTLGSGALLAVLSERFGLRTVSRHPLVKGLLVVGLFWTAWTLQIQWDRRDALSLVEKMIIATKAPLLCWIVLRAADGMRGPLGMLLGSAFFRYLGRISYGLYVFHAFPYLLSGWGPIAALHPLLRFVFFGAVTVGISELSWRILEAPINRFKSRFPYAAPPPAEDQARTAA